MRRAALALLTLMALLAGYGGRVRSGHDVKITSKAASLSPSGFVVQPDIADPSCNGGGGVSLAVGALGENPVLASATMTDGSTLTALTNVSPRKRSAVLYSITRTCTPNPEFGEAGTATITIPASLEPPKPTGPGFDAEGIWIDTVAPRNGGGAIIAGIYGDDWVIGEVTARGMMDQTFGTQGWVVLPFPGEISAIVQEPSGRIVIAGDNGLGGCCTVNRAAALSERGQLENGFGTSGRTVLPTGEDSGVRTLALEPNGDILAEIGYGNMGCWGTALAMLTPSGAPEPMFAKRLHRFWEAHRFGAFVGDTYIDGEGFTLIGTGQKPCYDEPPGSTAPATGLLARFRPTGEPSGPTIRFHSRMYGEVHGFPDGHDTILIASPYADQTDMTLTALRSDGSTDPRFASHGHAQIRTPARRPSVEVIESPPGEIALLATLSEPPELQLIHVRL